MPNLFVITPKTDISLEKGLLRLKNENGEKEVSISKTENIFLFNGNKIGFFNVRKLKGKNVHIYSINKYGHLKAMFIPKQKGYRFNKEKHLNILAYILVKESIFLMSLIKKINRLNGSIDISFIKERLGNYFLGGKTVDEKSLRYVHMENLRTFYQTMNSAVYEFNRKYENKDNANVVINLFHSLTISYITTFLQKAGLDTNQEITSLFQNKKNYPPLSRVFFIMVRNIVTMRALETLKNLLNKHDFAFLGGLRKEGLMIVSKIFTESIVHNENLNSRLELLVEELKNVEKGNTDYYKLLVLRGIF